jgi:hypothetical protein
MDATLGVMQDYIEGARDGWGIVLDGIVAATTASSSCSPSSGA